MGQFKKQGPELLHVKLRFSDLEPLACRCGAEVFIEARVLRRVPRVLSPTGRPDIIDVPVLACPACGAWYTESDVEALGKAQEDGVTLSAKPKAGG